MKIDLFRIWLFQQNFKKTTVENRISICNRIERNGIDLENEFKYDNGKNLLSILTYSKKEKDDNIKPKHNIPIEGEVLTGTSTLKHSANLYFLFCQSLNRQIIPTSELKEDIAHIEKDKATSEEEKRVLIKYRLGQSVYRKRLIEYWEGCSVSGCDFIDALIASHIKPWSESEPNEKYDLYNGLLLSPNYDKLFDRYLISFDEKGSIIISNQLTDKQLNDLKISKSAKLNTEKLTVEHLLYLKNHRANLQ